MKNSTAKAADIQIKTIDGFVPNRPGRLKAGEVRWNMATNQAIGGTKKIKPKLAKVVSLPSSKKGTAKPIARTRTKTTGTNLKLTREQFIALGVEQGHITLNFR